jgi:predicted MarR family transcription regulator
VAGRGKEGTMTPQMKAACKRYIELRADVFVVNLCGFDASSELNLVVEELQRLNKMFSKSLNADDMETWCRELLTIAAELED